MLRRSKKGISPLIATVLLIAFAVALGAVVMNVSVGLLESEMAKPAAPCASLKLDLFLLRGRPQLCFGDGKINYKIVNVGTEQASGVRIQIVGEKGIADGQIDTALNPADITDGSVPYSLARNGNVLSARFIPLSGTQLCQDQAVQADEINDC